MPSQIFDDGYGMYEVPSGERLVFKGGEGADASYNLPSSFDRASSLSQRGRRSVMGSADRFTSAGSYLKNSSAPGPGSYTVNPTAKPSSRYGVLGPELQRDQDRLKFEGVGEGADAIYSTQSAFDNKTPNKSGGGFGASKRFGKVDSYVSGSYSDAPGPGAYTASPGVKGDINGVRKNGPAPPQNGGNRLNFAPSSGMGESPGPVYKVHTHVACVCMHANTSVKVPCLILPLSACPSRLLPKHRLSPRSNQPT